jgi:hypothetical protein
MFLTCTYIVSFICVIIHSQGVPDDDPRRGSKHVGLTYNTMIVIYNISNRIITVHLLVEYSVFNLLFINVFLSLFLCTCETNVTSDA